MRNLLSSVGDTLKGALNTAWDQIPDVSLISDIEVPVYVLHHGPGAEDYELLCDFETFMKESQSGLLKRPALRIWAGRSDFERHLFACHLREAFSNQFDMVRNAHRAEAEARRKSWLQFPSLSELILMGLTGAAGLAGSLLLYLATSMGGKALEDIFARLKSAVGASSDPEQELEKLIAEKKSTIDEGLARIEISLHRDLYAYAWRGQRPGPMTGIDRDAWPLPGFVRERMDD